MKYLFLFGILLSICILSIAEYNSYNNQNLKSINSNLYNSVIKNNPEDGLYFLNYNSDQIGKIVIIDNSCNILFFKEFTGTVFNFGMQTTGLLSFYSTNDQCFYLMDSLFNIVDTYKAKNDYVTNCHELIIQENGHAFLMADAPRVIDMSQIVTGGKQYATVIGLIIQELDENRNLIFEWSSWDHINITDCDNTINLTLDNIDYVHGNGLYIDSDTSFLLSSRNLCEITKINRKNGEIIWRLGGKNNEFEFINENKMFAFQHSLQKLDNGHFILFDNGRFLATGYSRGVEYIINEKDKKIAFIKEYRHSPDIYASAMGSIQKLDNGNILIGWGSNFRNCILTEFTENGTIVNEITSEVNASTYRARKYNWKPNYVKINIDTINFDPVVMNTLNKATVSITNNINDIFTVSGYLNYNNTFYTEEVFPIVFNKNERREIEIFFNPTKTGKFETDLVFCSDHVNDIGLYQRIAYTINVKGEALLDTIESINFLSENEFKIFPNPAKDYLKIICKTQIKQMFIFNNSGKLFTINPVINADNYEVDIKFLQEGVYYFYIIDATDNIHIQKILKLYN